MKSSKRLIFIFYFVLFFTTFVTSQSIDYQDTLEAGGEAILNSLTTFFTLSLPILNITAEALYLMLFFLILATLVYTAIDQMDFLADSFLIKSILSLSVAGLAYIALPEQFIELLIPSYKSMFSSIFTIVPFALIVTYATTKVRNQFIARVLWLAITIATTLLFITEGIPAYQNGEIEIAILYTGLMLVGIIGTIWIKAIRSWVFKSEISELTHDRMRGVEIDSALRKAHQSEAENLASLVRKSKK